MKLLIAPLLLLLTQQAHAAKVIQCEVNDLTTLQDSWSIVIRNLETSPSLEYEVPGPGNRNQPSITVLATHRDDCRRSGYGTCHINIEAQSTEDGHLKKWSLRFYPIASTQRQGFANSNRDGAGIALISQGKGEEGGTDTAVAECTYRED